LWTSKHLAATGSVEIQHSERARLRLVHSRRHGVIPETAPFRAKRKRGASAEATQIGDSVPSRFRVELVEEWDEPDYVGVKCRDPDGYIVEAAWEPER
jgi:hypothetical protein